MQEPPQEILEQWELVLISSVAETGLAQVWKVRHPDGVTAALKLYRRADRGNEAPGTTLLKAWHDRGAVIILKETRTAVLMEWLEGPTLGDIARRGKVDQALEGLAQTAARLHAPPIPQMAGLRPLRDVFKPLYGLRVDKSCPAGLARDMNRATVLAQNLLDTPGTAVPLHGDLHPDNVILTRSGPRVMDAKGYLGDPAFELANAIRHPKGMPDLVRQPEHMERCLSLYAVALGVQRKRLAQWAAAKCALSIFWRADGPITGDKEADLLGLLLSVSDQ